MNYLCFNCYHNNKKKTEKERESMIITQHVLSVLNSVCNS